VLIAIVDQRSLGKNRVNKLYGLLISISSGKWSSGGIFGTVRSGLNLTSVLSGIFVINPSFLVFLLVIEGINSSFAQEEVLGDGCSIMQRMRSCVLYLIDTLVKHDRQTPL